MLINILTLSFLVFNLGCANHQLVAQVEKPLPIVANDCVTKSCLKIMEAILTSPEAGEGITVQQGSIVVESSKTRELVAKGQSILPLLVEILGYDDLEFNTFVRCYSIADQILAPLGYPIQFAGGGVLDRESRINRFLPKGQNQAKLQKYVCDQISKSMIEIRASDSKHKNIHPILSP